MAASGTRSSAVGAEPVVVAGAASAFADAGFGGELDGALEAQAEAGVRDGAVAPQVEIPPVALGVQAALGHATLEHVAALLNHVAHKPESAAELKGALDMAYKILGLPATLTKDAKLQARYNELLQQDMAGVAAVILQRRFEG